MTSRVLLRALTVNAGMVPIASDEWFTNGHFLIRLPKSYSGIASHMTEAMRDLAKRWFSAGATGGDPLKVDGLYTTKDGRFNLMLLRRGRAAVWIDPYYFALIDKCDEFVLYDFGVVGRRKGKVIAVIRECRPKPGDFCKRVKS